MHLIKILLFDCVLGSQYNDVFAASGGDKP